MLITNTIQVLEKLFCSSLYILDTVRYYNQIPQRFWTVNLLTLKMGTAMKVRGGFKQKKKLRQINLLNSSSQHGCNDSYKLNHCFPVTNIFSLIFSVFQYIGYTHGLQQYSKLLDWAEEYFVILKNSFSP